MSTDNNNNKNNRDEEDNNNIINKKQKIDKDDEIDISNLNSYTVGQLKLYGDKIGISFSSKERKGEIIEKIEIVVKRNKELLAKQEIQANLNSFNKGVIELVIKQGIQHGELLFWKVFRHKVLYKKIMSNMNKRLSIDYDSITLVEKMIKSNKSYMLRDKVIRNQNLTFSNGVVGGGPFNSIFKLFKSNTDQDRLFYQRLFQNYSDYSLDFKNVSVQNGVIKTITNGRENLVDQLIELKCIPALQVLIQHYQYKSTIQNLKDSINKGSSKLIDLILQSNPTTTLKNSIKLEVMPVNSLNYLIDQELIEIKIGENERQSKNYKLLKSVIGQYKINEEMSLKELINIGKLITNCLPSSLILEKQEIISFTDSLTKNELASKLNVISNQSTTKREIIKKLIELYHSFTNISRYQLPHLYFNDENRNNFKDIGTYASFIGFEQSLQFANIETLEFYYRKGCLRFNDYLIKILSSNQVDDRLFSFCNTLVGLTEEEIKIRQMKFIDLTIKMVKEERLCDPLLYFYLIVNHGDLELIKYVSPRIGTISFNHIPKYKNIIVSTMIKSTSILEYLFSNHYNCFLINSDPFYFGNVELLKQFEALFLEKNKAKSICINLNYTSKKDELTINAELLQYILSRKIITNGYNHIYSFISSLNESDQDKYELCKLFYIKYGILGGCLGGSQYYIRFIDWVYENFKVLLLDKNKKEQIIYQTSRFQDLDCTVNFDSDKFWHNLETVDFENIGLLDYYIKTITKDENYIKNNLIDVTNSIYLILSDAAEFGRLKTFEFISIYHSWILKVKTSSSTNKGLFVQGEFASLLHTSLKSSNIKVSEFLFSLYSITESEFKEHSSDISLVYFNNKFN